MIQFYPIFRLLAVLFLGMTISLCSDLAMAAPAEAVLPEPVASSGVPGGLCVQLGAKQTGLAEALARSGRFVVQVLDVDAERIEKTRRRLSEGGLYGLISADPLAASGRLPYTENLVNIVLVTEPIPAKMLAEVRRVLCPNGVVLGNRKTVTSAALSQAGLTTQRAADPSHLWTIARKPWPAEMDEWTHPRHSAAGNAVSQDTVVGPPRRVRWLAGPWQEVANTVTGDGRNYYGGILARDGFNGLRLWQQSLSSSVAKGEFDYRPARGTAAPITGDQWVFVVQGATVQALDGRTGKLLRTFSESSKPHHMLYDDGFLVTVEANKIQGFDAATGRLSWTHEGEELRYVVAGDGLVGLLQGSAKRGQKVEVVVLDERTGALKWKRDDYPWATRVTRSVYHQGLLSFEISTLNNDGPGNRIQLVSAQDGKPVYELEFLPGMNHVRQARAMFIGDRLWLLQGGQGADKKRKPTEVSSIYIPTGKVEATYPAGLAHCFPPVATTRYLFSGVMNLTDLQSGRVDANRITKAACGRDVGWVPAHGLINVAPKHCVCWPMLRGYAALAPARPGGNPANRHLSEMEFPVEQGVTVPKAGRPSGESNDWPCYRHDAWRSGSTTGEGPAVLKRLWSVTLDTARRIDGPILQDWQEDPFIKGPITAPVIAEGTVVVARPHAHQVVALDAATGKRRWQFVASGRVDTPPTIYRGRCLFGSKNGWVYCLRLSDGQLAWRLRAAPHQERIVAYGQVESPWPVPGSILVVDDVAYFAAGRQSFADGGILVFAVDPRTGKTHWVQRLDSIPQKGYYTSSALEFDNFDLLRREGDGVAMSRWVFERATGKMTVDLWKAFSRLNTGGGSAMVPQGCWSYPPRNQSRTKTFSPRRPLVVFRDNVLFGCLESKQSVYRRDFDLEGGEQFNSKWITGWAGSEGSRKNGLAWRSQRLAEKARWKVDLFAPKKPKQTIDGLVLTRDRLYLAGSDGTLNVLSRKDGSTLTTSSVAAPVWDGMAVANGRLYLATRDGRLLCLGER